MTGLFLPVIAGFVSTMLHLSPVNLLDVPWVLLHSFGSNHGEQAGKHIGSIVKTKVLRGSRIQYVKSKKTF